jgi:DNA-binding XRE family transcriptional regulator
MKTFYDIDRDYAEIFFKTEKNYGETLTNAITEFHSEKSDKIVGYGFEDASQSLFKSDLISPSVKLAVLLKIIRGKQALTQQQATKLIGDITLRHYQRLESGEENPTLGTIESLMLAFPKADFSLILKPSPKVVA